ncbi:hypothetical protein [Deinococcus apachensis]|uniref:hypothetical protein n=1 Tax=Deinococcus apachensis TaxID=309886 RepID=UPI0003784672|nr:hypothetical protein [Deinococcus apachensis]
MGAPDPHASSNVLDALKYAVGLFGGSILTAFAKNFFTTGGQDAREFRQEYREEIKRLREERAKDQEEIEELREDIRALRSAMEDQRLAQERQMRELHVQIERLTTRSLYYLTGRSEARALLLALETEYGRPPRVWPEDPKEGGT